MVGLEKIIDENIEKGILEHIAVRVGKGDKVIYDTYRGGVDETTLFDMASVTKIMATTSLTLIALDNGLLSLSGLEPIRFISANICICFSKFPCNIRILLRKFISPILNICSI